jgi:hypothetical protein
MGLALQSLYSNAAVEKPQRWAAVLFAIDNNSTAAAWLNECEENWPGIVSCVSGRTN